MDVRLPDGRILKNVPEGTTRAQIEAKLGSIKSASPIEAEPAASRTSPGWSAVAGANRGIAGIAGLPVDTLLNVADLARAGYGTAAAALGRPDLSPAPIDRSGIVGSSEHLSSLMNRGGIATVPQGNTAADRYAFAAGTGVAGGMAGPKNALSNTLRGVAGGMAAQTASEADASPATVAAAAMLGGGAPEIARGGVRVAIRGGETGRRAMQDTIDTFTRAGATPSIGQATENRAWRAVESVLSKIPGGAGVMESRAQRQQGQLGAGVDALASGLSPNANATSAGRRVVQGVEGDFLPKVRATQSRLYQELDQKIPPQASVPITNTYSALDRIAQGIPNAQAVSGTKLIRNSMADDLLEAIKADAPYGGLPYEALKAIRSRVGEKLNEFDLSPDVPRQQLKQIYAGLTEDMRVAAALNGPEAMAAFQRANNFTKAMHGRIESLQSVIDKAGGPEKVFLAATSGTGEGATTLRTVMRSLPKEGQSAVTASVIRRLGRATPGKQNDVGDQFSTETFLTNWAKLSPEAKTALGGPHGPEFRKNLDALASVANNLRQGSKVFANPSGTSTGLASISTASGVASAAATGNIGLAATVMAGVAGANGAARLMTNPAFVKWAAAATRAPKSATRAQLAMLATIANREGDADMAQLAEDLKQSQ